MPVKIGTGSIFANLTASRNAKKANHSTKKPVTKARPIKELVPELLGNAYPKTVFQMRHMDDPVAHWVIFWVDGPTPQAVKATLKAGVRIPPAYFEDDPEWDEQRTSVKFRLCQFAAKELPSLNIDGLMPQKDRLEAIQATLKEKCPNVAFEVQPVKTSAKVDIINVVWQGIVKPDEIQPMLAQYSNGVTQITNLIHIKPKEAIEELMAQIYMEAYVYGEEVDDIQEVAKQILENGA